MKLRSKQAAPAPDALGSLKPDRLPARRSNSKWQSDAANRSAGPWLVVSSLFFMQPIAFASCIGVHEGPVGFVSKWCAAVSVISICYWLRPEPGWRLTLDINVARMSFFVVLVTASIWGEANQHGVRLFAIINGGLIILFYKLSCHFFDRKKSYWPVFHALMHFSGGLNQAVCCWIMTRSTISAATLDTCHLSTLDRLFSVLNLTFNRAGPLDDFFRILDSSFGFFSRFNK
jgi:hypothetical protein